MPQATQSVSVVPVSYSNPVSIGINPCEETKAIAEATTALSASSIFTITLSNIQNAFAFDGKEHAVTFGKDENDCIISSPMNTGTQTYASVPYIINAFADLHNHPGNHPPDAGDLYGLIDLNRKYNNYGIRIVVTQNKTIYALVITDSAAAVQFNSKYPRGTPACPSCSIRFPDAIVDEFREIKYKYGCTDEMALAFILEKYKAGISLLKQDNNHFYKLSTSVSWSGTDLVFIANNCY